MIKPEAQESQPDFAIRFHEAMQAEIPRTSERNAAMLGQWDKYGIDESRDIAASTFDSEHYDKRSNIAIFAEHATQDRKTPSGKTIPGRSYDRDKLRAIVDNHNYQATDVSTFSPITDGHTSEDPAAAKPPTLGFSGSAKLGMIGDKQPRWAIFHDEYQRKDCKERFDAARHRSVEVMLTPKVEDSYFWPIAALDTDAPRLSMPPARYSAKCQFTQAELPVEQYSLDLESDRYMAAPGGNNTMAQAYGMDGMDSMHQQQPTEMPDPNTDAFNLVMQSLMNSQWGQVITEALEQMAGSMPGSAVAQPPEMADMPLDNPDADPAQMQGQQPMPGQPSQMQGGPPMQGQQPQMQQQMQPPPSQQPPLGGTPPPMQANPPMQQQQKSPYPNQEQYSMSDSKDQYSALEARLNALEAENTSLKDAMAEQQAQAASQERYSKLSELAQTHALDVERELQRTEKYSAEQFATHLEVISEHYTARPDAVRDFAAMSFAPGKAPKHVTESQALYGELSEEECDNVAKYARDNKINSWEVARERYSASQKEAAPVAG